MKKSLLFSICILFTLASCKKSADVVPANTISATIDGVDESFNANAMAQIGTGVQLNSNLVITGTNGTATASDGMSLTINSNSSIVAASYTNSGSNNSGFMSILYSHGPFSLVNPPIYTTDVNGAAPGMITIISISSTNIQGTFSGKLLFRDGVTAKSVTNGKFNLSFK